MALVLKNVLFVLVVPGTVGVYLPLWIARDRTAVEGPGRWLAAALIAAGASVLLWCVYDFAAYGRGTPAPIDAPRRLVVRGLYLWTRNPMYVGVLTVIAGWAILFASTGLAAYAVLVAAGFQSFVVLYEEPHLRRRFGPEYEQYTERVGRWGPRRRNPDQRRDDPDANGRR